MDVGRGTFPRTRGRRSAAADVPSRGDIGLSGPVGGLRRRWLGTVAAGAAAAWAVPVLLFAVVAGPWSRAALVIAGGAAACAALAVAQAAVLRRWLGGFPVGAWIAVSVAAAAVEWSVIALVAVWGERVAALPTLGQVLVVVTAMVSVTFALGICQWSVLRRWSDQAVLWIWANAVAWIMGAAIFVAVAQPIRAGVTMTVTAATIAALVGVMLRGTVFAVITGMYLSPVLCAAHPPAVVADRAAPRSRTGAAGTERSPRWYVRAFGLFSLLGGSRPRPSSENS